jgi:hypothetical protein
MLSKRKRVITVGLEATYGVDATPTAAILCGDITFKPLAGGTVERKNIRPYFGNNGKIRTESYTTISFPTELAGSGTAGTATAHAPLFKACNMSETVTAAPITGTAQVGGSTTSIKLASGASATNDFYTGMTVSITTGTGSGQSGEIISYDGTSKIATLAKAWAEAADATSDYSIGANVLYLPNSSFGAAANTSLSMYFNVDGVRHILLGARGTVKWSIAPKAIPELTWDFTGLLGTITDTALPATDFTAWKDPVAGSTANTTDINLLGFTGAVLESLNFDLGNKVVYRNLIGTESVIINDRNTTGDFSIEATTVATKDWWADAKNGAYGPICIKHGQSPGNIITTVGSNVQSLEPDYGDSDDVMMLKSKLDFIPKGVSGNDEIRICFK